MSYTRDQLLRVLLNLNKFMEKKFEKKGCHFFVPFNQISILGINQKLNDLYDKSGNMPEALKIYFSFAQNLDLDRCLIRTLTSDMSKYYTNIHFEMLHVKSLLSKIYLIKSKAIKSWEDHMGDQKTTGYTHELNFLYYSFVDCFVSDFKDAKIEFKKNPELIEYNGIKFSLYKRKNSLYLPTWANLCPWEKEMIKKLEI